MGGDYTGESRISRADAGASTTFAPPDARKLVAIVVV
jgi:hypothetical protein